MARSKCNLDKLVSEFEKRVEDDIQHGIMQRDKQFPRYVRHFRQLLDDSSAVCKLVEPGNSGPAKKGQLGSPDTSQTSSLDDNHEFSIDSEDYSPRNTCIIEANSPGNRLPENFFEDTFPTTCRESSALPVSNITAPTTEPSDSNQRNGNSPILGRLSMDPDETEREFNNTSHSAQLRQRCPGPFELEARNVLGFMASVPQVGENDAIRVCDPTYELFDGDYMMSDDLLADLLQIENEKIPTMSRWKNQSSGNDFLETI